MIERVGVIDVASISAQQDTILVLPTLLHAHHLWPAYRDAIKERHNFTTRQTKTGLAMPLTRTTLRLWVPYRREPTMHMDLKSNHGDDLLVSPYEEVDVRLYDGWF